MDIQELLARVRKRARKLEAVDFEAMLDEVRRYLPVSDILPPVVNFEDPKTIRKGQKALMEIEARLDRIIAIHHDAKRTLQIIAVVEHQLLAAMVRTKLLPEKTTGPAQQQKLNVIAPVLVRVRIRWQTVDQICTQAQQRLAAARDSLKLMGKLDDNLRWAQERVPG